MGVVAVSSFVAAYGFETEGVSVSVIGGAHYFGEPIHQDITREGLYFLKTDPLELIVSQHPIIEEDQSSPNHFDNCQFTETIDRINARYDVAVSAFNPVAPSPALAAEKFGFILHAAQDFYSHSNWIEMQRTDMVDPWLTHWRMLSAYSDSSNDRPVFVLEEDGSPYQDFQISIRNKRVTVNHEMWDATGSGRKMGLISGTFDADVNKCPASASIPHGGKLINRFFRTPEATEFPNELNKDNPAIKGHAAARQLAVQQTTHEFCRLVELTRQTYGERGVDVIYDNWVQDQYRIDSPANNAICPRAGSSQTGIDDPRTSLMEKSSLAIPDWIKQNARWWSDGTITDRDFATGIGFLVKERIISVNAPVSSDGSLLVNDNLQIPDWIRTNARWWSDGTITNQDFTSGIEYMIKQEIITFSEKRSAKHMLGSHDDQEFFMQMYGSAKWNEAAAVSLANLNNAEQRIITDLTAQAWDQYHSSSDPQAMEEAKTLESLLGSQNLENQKIGQFQDSAKKATGQIKTAAKLYGVSSFDLDKTAESAQKKIDKPLKISKVEQLKEGLNEAKNLGNKASIPGQNPFEMIANPETNTGEIAGLMKEFASEINMADVKIPKSASDEDKVLTLLLEITKQLDEKIADQTKQIQDINSDSSKSPDASIDLETMQLKRLTEKRQQFFDIFRQVVERYSETSRGAIQSLRDGGPVTEAQTEVKVESGGQPVTPPQNENTRQVSVLVIEGKYYPISQFFEVGAHQPNCDAIHYHSEFSNVRSIDGTVISDPNPSTCGFGKVGLIPVDVVSITQQQSDSFKAAVGFEP